VAQVGNLIVDTDWKPDLTEEPADPGPETSSAILVELLAHLVTGHRNTLGQWSRPIVVHLKAFGFSGEIVD